MVLPRQHGDVEEQPTSGYSYTTAPYRPDAQGAFSGWNRAQVNAYKQAADYAAQSPNNLSPTPGGLATGMNAILGNYGPWNGLPNPKPTPKQSGGDPFAAARGRAQGLMSYYGQLLNSGWLGSEYLRVLDAANQTRDRSIGEARKFVRGEQRGLRREARRAGRRIDNQTEALERYLKRNYEDPFAAPGRARAENIDDSATLLADQGGNTADVERARQQANTANAANDVALRDYYDAMSANSRDGLRSDLAAARLSGMGMREDLRTNRMAVASALANMLFGARQNAWNQYDQTNLQIQSQIAQREQALRDQAAQLAFQYGLEVPF